MFIFRSINLLIILSALLVISCQHESEMENAQRFGGEVTMEKSVSLTEIYDNPDQYKDKEIRVEGTIKEVCQQRGCWLKLTDGTKDITVRFKDYGFFVPKDAATSRVIVQGIFTMEPDMHVEQESEAQAEGKEDAEGEEHSDEREHDSGLKNDEDAQSKVPFSFTASAVEIYSDTKIDS